MSVHAGALPTLLLAVGLVAPLPASPIKSDEQVLLPTRTARLDSAGQLKVRAATIVYELERRPGMTSALAHYLDLDRAALTADELDLLYNRTQLFRIDFERNKAPTLRFANAARTTVRMPRSNAHGLSEAELRLPPLTAPPAANQWLDYAVVLPKEDARRFAGRALLLTGTGISVVSDIDDTIKESNVLDRRELLLNTFVRPFRAVPGMAQTYLRWAAADPRVALHYLSGSPMQMQPALEAFLDAEAFPAGTLHLREIDLSDEVFGQSGGTPAHKSAVLEQLIADFPQRRFLLVGDSGEHDPEIYGAVARRHPQAILAIHIRDVTGQPAEDPRYAQAFDQLPRSLWSLFRQAAELPADLPGTP